MFQNAPKSPRPVRLAFFTGILLNLRAGSAVGQRWRSCISRVCTSLISLTFRNRLTVPAGALRGDFYESDGGATVLLNDGRAKLGSEQ